MPLKTPGWPTSKKAPADLDFFTSVAAGVAKADSPDTSTVLLQMFDDQLEAAEHWVIRIELLKRCGQTIMEKPELHDAIVTCLRHLYGDRGHFEEMLEKVGLEKAKEDIPKTWQKAERFESLMAFDVGSIVRMRGKGAGRIEEVNMALESFKISLEGGIVIRVGFGGAA